MQKTGITFRAFKKSDIPLRVKWLNDKSSNKWYIDYDIRRTTSRAVKQWFAELRWGGTDLALIIVVDGVPAGMVGYFDRSFRSRNAVLYIYVGEKQFRGRGVGKAALQHLLKICFLRKKMHKVLLTVYTENTVAVGLFRSAGFVEEGRLTEMEYFDGAYHDTIYMTLLASEWKKRVH
jgi:RimJ/RimL family protein N-acetyltransferase